MNNTENQTRFQLVDVDRRYIWSDLEAFGIDRQELEFLSVTFTLPIIWTFERSPAQPDYTAAQALFLRDHWMNKKPTAHRFEFADEMRALAASVWEIFSGETPSPDGSAAILDVLLSALDQQSERLKVLWILGQPQYTEQPSSTACRARKALPVSNDILHAVIAAAPNQPFNAADASHFNEWLMKWLTVHLRYYLYDAATKQFGAIGKA